MLRFIVCCSLCGAGLVWLASRAHPTGHQTSQNQSLYALEGNYSGWSPAKAKRAHEQFLKEHPQEQPQAEETTPSPQPGLYAGLDASGRIAVGTPGPDGTIMPGEAEKSQIACIARQLNVSYQAAEQLAAQAQAYYEYENAGAYELAPDASGLSPQTYIRLTAAAIACLQHPN
jgi:hypothetical protein